MFLEAIELQDYETAITIFDGLLFREVAKGDCLNACSRSNYNGSNVINYKGGCSTCR